MSRQKIINDNLRTYIRMSSKLHRFGGINKHNTREHEFAKLIKAFELYYDEGCEVLIEPILKNGYRPDILVLDTETPIAYEIVMTEKEESLVKKQTSYEGIEIKVVKL